jgi:hypothetical protein
VNRLDDIYEDYEIVLPMREELMRMKNTPEGTREVAREEPVTGQFSSGDFFVRFYEATQSEKFRQRLEELEKALVQSLLKNHGIPEGSLFQTGRSPKSLEPPLEVSDIQPTLNEPHETQPANGDNPRPR